MSSPRGPRPLARAAGVALLSLLTTTTHVHAAARAILRPAPAPRLRLEPLPGTTSPLKWLLAGSPLAVKLGAGLCVLGAGALGGAQVFGRGTPRTPPGAQAFREEVVGAGRVATWAGPEPARKPLLFATLMDLRF